MCQDAGVVLAYLPPYSPDLNPIEESFAQLKQWIKKNRILAEQFGDDFAGFLRCGLEAIQSTCKGHFRKCQISLQNLEMMTIWMVIDYSLKKRETNTSFRFLARKGGWD